MPFALSPLLPVVCCSFYASDLLVPKIWVYCGFIRSSLRFCTVEEVLWEFLCISRCPGMGNSCTGQ